MPVLSFLRSADARICSIPIYLEERSWENPDLRAMLRDRYVQKLDWRVERLTTNGR